MCFEAVLGLRINLGKSELAPIGQVSDMQGLASVLGGRIISLPMKYLGLPWGQGINRRIFGTQFWRRWRNVWLGGKEGIYLKVADLL